MNFTDRLSKRLNEQDIKESYKPEGEKEYIETFESSPFFGVENVRNSPACIDLRLKDNNFKSIPYSFILEINFNPSEGIEIVTTARKISITGRNLKLLYGYLSAFRVRYIQANIGNDLTQEKSLFINNIKVEDN